MRLTTLDIKGFKSFAEKTTIHFDQDITGVVGPNGCGKSNVVDAIRWVLGEQKTSMLRSEKMENVIFNGSKKRKASGLAQVALTFENTKNVLPTEYSTVTIKRTLYRSGESEYRINDVSCRLKDITSLFMDTGISSDSYAIIELGMINEILNDKDNSRRKLFEQAAGIAKYKTRKRETLLKLNATENDLNRVEDLLFEIDHNLKILESQARKTERYYKLKDQYRQISIESAKFALTGYKKTFETLKEQQQNEEDQKLKIETALKSLESKLEKEKAANIDKEKQLAQMQKEVNELIHEINQKEARKDNFKEKINYLTERKHHLTGKMEQAVIILKGLKAQIEELETKLGQEQQKLTTITGENDTLGKALSATRESHQNAGENLRTRQLEDQETEKSIFEVEKQLAINKAQEESLSLEIRQSASETSSKDKELKSLRDLMATLADDRKAAEGVIASIEKEEQALKAKVQKKLDELDELKQSLVADNRQLDAKQNEYNLTKSLVDNLEGFPESIKFLRKNASWAKDAPLLSDIIFCKEAYRATIENYLEPYLNYYVVNSTAEALAAVNLLSEASKGRANFFILEALKDYKPAKLKAEKGAFPALDIVEVEKPYRHLCNFLLDQVLILEESGGKDFDPGKQKDAIYLSQSGKFIRTRFSFSGGAVGLFEGKKIGRIKNMEKLQKEITTLEKKTFKTKNKVNDLQDAIKKLEETSHAEAFNREQEKLNRINNEYASLDSKIEQFEAQIKGNHQKRESSDARIRELAAANKELTQSLEALKDKRSANLQSLQQLETDYEELSRQLDEYSKNFNQAQIRFHQQQNMVNSIVQELGYKKEQQEHTEKEQAENAQTLEQSDTDAKKHRESIKTLEAELLEQYEQKEKKEADLHQTETDYYGSRGNINELEQEYRNLNRGKDKVDLLINEAKEKITELKIELNALKERLSIEFEVDINTIINEDPSTEWNEAELQAKLEKIRRRLENFGEINPMAIEAFKEMKERHTFITDQKNDLIEAKTSLLQTIEEIETTAKKHFLEAFAKARDNFVQVFQHLFTSEDECNLLLTDPENPLESEIEIIAKPKGKRPLTINQLSGGEKALTALAMLFALYLLKPAPFSILDEVDAPLDDNNIGKFKHLIREFSENSQFILVTHNKQTMASVDVIYGVTMQEEGISKVVPVDFSKLN